MVKTMSKDSLTFGVPAYNCGDYIGDLLKCFKDKSFINYEILIVNDGSTDNTLDVCKSFSHLNIRIINQMNSGVSAARNKIIQETRTKWLTFVDSDDTIIFSAYEEAFKKIIEDNSDFLIYSPKRKCTLTNLIENEIINPVCMKFYNTKLLKDNKIEFDKSIDLGEDLLFNLNYYKNSKKISYFFKNMYVYRNVNASSLTHKYRKNKFDVLMKVNETAKGMFNEKKILKSFEYIRIKNNFSCLKSEIIHNNNNAKKYLINIRNYKKIRFILLNNLKANLIYYMWYLMPSNVLIYLVRLFIREVKK